MLFLKLYDRYVEVLLDFYFKIFQIIFVRKYKGHNKMEVECGRDTETKFFLLIKEHNIKCTTEER